MDLNEHFNYFEYMDRIYESLKKRMNIDFVFLFFLAFGLVVAVSIFFGTYISGLEKRIDVLEEQITQEQNHSKEMSVNMTKPDVKYMCECYSIYEKERQWDRY